MGQHLCHANMPNVRIALEFSPRQTHLYVDGTRCRPSQPDGNLQCRAILLSRRASHYRPPHNARWPKPKPGAPPRRRRPLSRPRKNSRGPKAPSPPATVTGRTRASPRIFERRAQYQMPGPGSLSCGGSFCAICRLLPFMFRSAQIRQNRATVRKFNDQFERTAHRFDVTLQCRYQKVTAAFEARDAILSDFQRLRHLLLSKLAGFADVAKRHLFTNQLLCPRPHFGTTLRWQITNDLVDGFQSSLLSLACSAARCAANLVSAVFINMRKPGLVLAFLVPSGQNDCLSSRIKSKDEAPKPV